MAFQTISCPLCKAQQHRHLTDSFIWHECDLKGQALTVVICEGCGLVFLNPQPTDAWLAKFYEHDYYKKNATPDLGFMRQKKEREQRHLFNWLAQNLPLQHKRILDIGSGFGIWLTWFDASNSRVGLEPSKQAAEYTLNLGLETHQQGLMDNTLPAESFDLLTALALIEHLTNPMQALAEFNRLLAVGGHLYLYTPDVKGVSLRRGIERVFKVIHTLYFSATTLSIALQASGFEVVALEVKPPVLEASSLTYPDRGVKDGILSILAQKVTPVAAPQIVSNPQARQEVESVLTAYQTAVQRDARYDRLRQLYKTPVVGGWLQGSMLAGSRTRSFLKRDR